MVATRAALVASWVAGMLLAAPASAQHRVPVPGCGDGYCDGELGEDAVTCPEDCYRPKVVVHDEPARPWSIGDPVPPGFHIEKRRSRGLLITGSVLFGTLWALSAAVGGSQIHNGGAYSFIPLAGSFISAYAYRDPPCHGWLCFNFGGVLNGLAQIILGVGQLTGASLLTAGLIGRHETLVPGTFVPVPILGQDHAGIGLAGAF